MNNIITFTIHGKIRGKGRPRAVKIGGHVRILTDAKTRSHEAVIRQFAALAMAGAKPIEGPVGLSVLVYVGIPASWSKKRRAAAYHVTGKPDADNIAKTIGDACNGILWRDDSQISDLRIKRRYTDDAERVEVVVTSLAAPAAIVRGFVGANS